MRNPGLVLDTSCLLAYAAGTTTEVGRLIAQRANRAETVLVPVLCLAEAYRQASAEQTNLLDLIQGINNVVVMPVEQDMALFLGGFTGKIGRMDLAQLALTATEHAVVPVMTSERDLVTQILAKEWPIIDL